MPLFSVVITNEELENRVKAKSSTIIELDERTKFKEFKDIVLSNVCSFFIDPKDIKISVHKHLNDFEKDDNLIGWIKGNDKNELELLEQENIKLKDIIKSLSKSNTLIISKGIAIPLNNNEWSFSTYQHKVVTGHQENGEIIQ